MLHIMELGLCTQLELQQLIILVTLTLAKNNMSVLGSESGAGAYFGLMLNNSGMIAVSVHA